MLVKIALLCLFISVISSQNLMGVCNMKGTALDPTINGMIKFYLSADGSSIIVEANITGITQNINQDHGMHVHEFGDISNVNGTATGAHYVGGGIATHGCPNNSRHAGDMGNWTVSAQGTLVQTKYLDLLPFLNGTNSIIGRAVILHLTFDDCVTQPTGNSGGRIGQCVIGVANPSTFATTNTNSAFADNSAVTKAGCWLTPTSNGGSISGAVYFSVVNGLTFITGQFQNLNASVTKRGIHIHQFGDLTNADGTSSGAHYNPDNYVHAIPPTVQRHKGDLGNLQYVDQNGVFWYYANNSYVNLSGANNIIGRAVILHIQEDDGCTQPTGNSGSRIGQCVIGVLDPNTVIPTAPTGIPDQSQPICATPGPTNIPTTIPTTVPTTASTKQPSSSSQISFSLFLLFLIFFFF